MNADWFLQEFSFLVGESSSSHDRIAMDHEGRKAVISVHQRKSAMTFLILPFSAPPRATPRAPRPPR
jgi:hypothetical protein